MTSTLVLGIGNTLLSDEGAGIHTLDYLQRHYRPVAGLRYLDGGTLSFTLAPEIEAADNLIVIDAAQMDATPGSIGSFVGGDLDRFVSTGKRSVHEVGLSDLLAMALLQGQLPPRRALIGIQPSSLDWGDKPTLTVAAAIPHAAAEVWALICRWHPGADGQCAEIVTAVMDWDSGRADN